VRRIDGDSVPQNRRPHRTGTAEESINVRSDGNHHRVYRATLQRFTLELADGEFTTEVECESEDVADRFTRMWEGL